MTVTHDKNNLWDPHYVTCLKGSFSKSQIRVTALPFITCLLFAKYGPQCFTDIAFNQPMREMGSHFTAEEIEAPKVT